MKHHVLPSPPLLFPALLLAVAVGLGLLWYATLEGSFGVAFLLGVPFTVGFFCGYYAVGEQALALFGLVGVLLTLAAGAVTISLAGVFCAVVAGLAFLVPGIIGMGVGHALRARLWSRLERMPGAALVLIVALGLHLEARSTPRFEPEEIVTTRIVDADRVAVWSALTFYEDVPLEPPLLARIGLPHPVGTEGVPDEVGALTRCRYTKGYLTKLVTELREGTLLAFDVVEQVDVEDRSVELLSGRFALEDAPGGGTRVTLTTRYRPLLPARWYWRPWEQRVCGALHRHVLDGIGLQACSTEGSERRIDP
ncbi:MAG: hypothetical protein AAF726_13265 [Planctomycetota bacterium]